MSTEATVEIVPASPVTTIEEYSKTAAGLADLVARYQGAKFDVATPAGMKLAVAARAELRTLRVDLEKKRVEIKAPALKRAKEIDTEAKRITAVIESLEEPIDQQIKADETRRAAEKAERERVERERLTAIQSRIATIRRMPLETIRRSAAEIATLLERARAIDVSDIPAPHRVDADAALADAIREIGEAHHAAEQREAEDARLAAERADLEAKRLRQEAELAEERRIADEAQRAERERDNRERAERQAEEARAQAEADRVRREQRDAEEAAHRAKLQAEREEADRARAIEDARRAEDAAREAKKREEERARLQAEQEELARRQAELDAAERERARLAREEEDRRNAEEQARLIAVERERIGSATLLEAAEGALALLAKRGLDDEIEAVVLAAAITRAKAVA